ncbi:MAG: NAD(P)H-hydrate dehydratase, partial [Cyclobacteriaceae bacterium]|nr:NAD(P)H-hydrate dehydratase [Cyclobacteriaceae bacterium]
SGLVTCYIPKSGLGIIQSSLPEVMALTDDAEYLTHPPELSRFSAIGIGPGMSTKIETVKFIRSLFENFHKPVVIDADALNLISENQELLRFIPVGSILTPHPGEFKRLVGDWKNDLEKISLQKAFSEKYQCIVVVKGHHTTITDPSGTTSFNTTGNPGMATAGSGDTLTGIITSLLGQGYTSEWSARAGVYLHGLAGDLAKKEKGEQSMIATDIIESISKAFSQI